MSETVLLKVTQLNFEKLRCSMCNGYLSCAPIRLLPDGSNLCGHCSPTDDVLTYRQLTLEAVLNEADFPCKFKQFGCTTRLLFGHGTNHENICRHRSFLCDSLTSFSAPSAACIWQGPLMKIPEHFMEDHQELVKNNTEFIFNVETSVKGIMMLVNADGAFFIKYEYNEETFNLCYDISHFLSNAEKAICKIRLTNESDSDYFLQLKGGNCVAFNTFSKPDTLIVSINKYLDSLNNPEDIKVKLSIIVTKSNLDNPEDSTELAVNYKVLEALRCSGCQYYLVPPIFYLRPNIICYECAKTAPVCPPARDRRIQSLIAEANYPCRWLECNFVAKADAIHQHEVSCKFRIYRCVISGCNVTFKSASIIDHLIDHSCEYFKEQFSYKINLKKPSDEISAFAVVREEIVLVELSTSTWSCCENGHYLSVQTSSFNPLQFNLSVQFGHDHCRCKSKKFSFNNMLTVRFCDLPRCFEIDDDLVCVLKID